MRVYQRRYPSHAVRWETISRDDVKQYLSNNNASALMPEVDAGHVVHCALAFFRSLELPESATIEQVIAVAHSVAMGYLGNIDVAKEMRCCKPDWAGKPEHVETVEREVEDLVGYLRDRLVPWEPDDEMLAWLRDDN